MTENTANTANHSVEHNNNNNEMRDNLREAGDALLAAGSALGAAFGKFAEGVPERFKSATDSAREKLSSANTEGEVRSWAANVTNEAEKAFNSYRERDVKFTDEAKQSLRSSVADVRTNFNERMDKLDKKDDSTIKDLRDRFESLVDRIQEQFAGDDAKHAGESGSKSAGNDGKIIDGEVVE